MIARYVYDAWGNFTVYDGTGKAVGTSETVYSSTTAIWNLNPFRYRGYYYDIETGLYYLLNRYYDPQTGRFLSLDNSSYADPETINGLNLYLYCNNNPVMFVDPTGEFIISAIIIGAVVGGIFGAIEGGISAQLAGRDVGFGILFGALGGAIIGAAAGAFGAAGVLTGEALRNASLAIGTLSFFVGGLTEAANQLVNGEKFNLTNMIYSGFKTSLSNMFSFAFANYIGHLANDMFDVLGTTLGTSILFFGINMLFNVKDFSNYGKKNILENY